MVERLPDLLFELKAALGQGALLRLLAHAAGRRIWIPKTVQAEAPLVRAVGIEVASWLIARYAGEAILIPAGPASTHNARVRVIRSLLTEQAATADIVKAAGCHERTVYRHRAALAQADERQMTLDLPIPPKSR